MKRRTFTAFGIALVILAGGLIAGRFVYWAVKEDQGDRLFQAAANGDAAQLTTELATGTSPNGYELEDGTTPLMTAAANGYDKCTRILLEHGAQVDAKDDRGLTAIDLAASPGVRLILFHYKKQENE